MNLNEKYQPLFKTKCRYIVCTGGRGSGKSFGIETFLTTLTFNPKHKLLITRYTMKSAHDSIIPEFLEKSELLGVSDQFHVTKTDVLNKYTGSSVMFRGIKTTSGMQTANLKSLQGVSVWVLDEAEELHDEDTFDTIDLSVRENTVQNYVIIIMNPATKEHFLYKNFFEGRGVNPGFNGEKDDTLYIHTDYRDNKANLSPSFLKGVERMRLNNPKKYRHKILGGWLDKAEGVIFTNWSIGDFDESLPYIYGGDYGFNPDPSTMIKVAVDKKKMRIYLDEKFYDKELTTDDIAARYRLHAGNNDLIVCDSAEPRLIHELKRKFFLNVVESDKGKGSVKAGIRRMRDYELVVTPSSINLVKELNNYSWSDKKSETPIDDFNHLIDPVRYAVSQLLGKPNVGKYFVY